MNVTTNHCTESCKLPEAGVITASSSASCEDVELMEQIQHDYEEEILERKSAESQLAKPLVDTVILDNAYAIPSKSSEKVDPIDVGVPPCIETNAGTNKTTSIFRENNTDSEDPSWMQRSFCNMQHISKIEEPIDAEVIEFDVRNDTETREGDFDTRRQSPIPERTCSFHVEVDEYNDYTQIEVLRTSYCADDSQSLGCSSDADNFSDKVDHRLSPLQVKSAEDNVFNKLLENNRFMCSGLESWYSMDEQDEEKFVEVEPELPRNRSCYPEVRKKRIEHLKINLTPFELDESAIVKGSINCKKFDPIKFEKRHQSFSSFNIPSPTSVTALKSPTMSSRFECHELPTCGPQANKLALVDWEENEDEDLCYDSDPNELLRSKAMVSQKKTERRKKEDVVEDEIQTVSQLMGAKMLLIWHRPVGMSPLAVHSWIEHGSYIHAGLIQPKLMWQESCGKEHKDSERFILNKMEFHSIDLLDISKVVPLNRVDRTLYPFAKTSCAFLIHAYDKEMVFEAESTADRDKFMDGLKILVARLGSKIIVGDKDVLEEFFTPASSSVPGRAPDILRTSGGAS